jgi:hypothetical protein
VTTKVSPSISLALVSRAACVMVKLVSSFVLNSSDVGDVQLSYSVNDGTESTTGSIKLTVDAVNDAVVIDNTHNLQVRWHLLPQLGYQRQYLEQTQARCLLC